MEISGTRSTSIQPTTNVALSSCKGISDCVVMPPSDAAISSSIDRPKSGPGVNGAGAVAGTEVAAYVATDKGFKSGLWTSHRKVEVCSRGVEVGDAAPRCSMSGTDTPLHSIATPRSERKWKGRGTGKRGGGDRKGGLAYDVRDAGITSDLARRARPGDPVLGIVGTRTADTSVNRWGYRG